MLGACGDPASDDPVRVYAAASLTDVVQTLLDDHAAAGGARAVAVVGATSTLARQLEAGARPGVFIAADPTWVAYLEERGLTEPGTRRTLATNRLVVVVPPVAGDVPSSPQSLAGPLFRRIAVGDPEHVPAGRYTRRALERLGLWEKVVSRLVVCADVRAVRALVARAEVDAGVVYATDARSPGVLAAFDLPLPADDPPIRYELVVAKGAPPSAATLADFLAGPAARAVLDEAGFER